MAAEMQEIPFRKIVPAWKDHLMNAIENKYGQDIEVLNYEAPKDQPQDHNAVENKLMRFVDDLVFKVIHCKDSMVKHRCVVDITNKEFYNSNMENVETEILSGKNTAISTGTRYHFLIKDGVCFDHKDNLGAQIVSIAMIGCNMRVGDKLTTTDQAYNQDLMFQYNHKEKLAIPPTTKVMAMITTSSKKFEQDYTLEFRIKQSEGIWFKYVNRRQQKYRRLFSSCCWCCGCCMASVGYVTASEILHALPNFRVEDDYCYFTLDGTLIWIGEEFSVQLNQSDI